MTRKQGVEEGSNWRAREAETGKEGGGPRGGDWARWREGRGGRAKGRTGKGMRGGEWISLQEAR